MPVRVESIANLKWLILVFYNAAFNDPNAVQNLRSRGGADLNEDLICRNLKKQLVLCYAKPHPPSKKNYFPTGDDNATVSDSNSSY